MRPSKTDFLFLVRGVEGYGVRRTWLGLTGELLRRGKKISLFSVVEGELADRMRELNIPVTVSAQPKIAALRGGTASKLLRMPVILHSQYKLFHEILDMVREVQPRRLLIRSPDEVMLAAMVARACRIPAFWLMPNAISDGYPFDLNRRIYRLAFAMGVHPIANSAFTETTLGPGRFARSVSHLGVDPQEFSPDAMATTTRQELGIPGDALVFGIFARAVPEKGQKHMAQALAMLGEKARSVHLLLCGGPLDTPYMNDLKAFVAQNALGPRVHILGPVARPRDYYPLCDVIVNSRIDPEPFGLSVIEAMMMAKPVMVHKAGGPGETVIDGETGWHVDGPEVRQFADGILRALDDRDAWPKIGLRARERALECFTVGAMANRLLAIIDKVEHESPRSPGSSRTQDS